MRYKTILLILVLIFLPLLICFASIKQPDFEGQFYPAPKVELSTMIDNFLEKADPKSMIGEIFVLISPHAGYGYSGQTAAFGYKLIKNKPYKTVIILGTSHHKMFNGAAVYGQGAFVTSLGQISIDEEFIKSIVGRDPELFLDESAFTGEHSVEVQIPFLQKVLTDFKIVPVVVGDCSLDVSDRIADLLKSAIGERKDVLVVVSTDLYHGYNFEETNKIDTATLELIKKMDYQGLYYGLRDGTAQACGGFAAVIALNLAKKEGLESVEVLNQTNSAIVTGKAIKGEWTVGYASCVILNLTPRVYKELLGWPLPGQGGNMLNIQQRKELLKIARDSIDTYLTTGKKLQVSQVDPILNREMGSFVTLQKHGQLRGCIGNLIGSQPLYLTVRDMAIQAAVGDPRFDMLSLAELKEIEIEISVLSPLERVSSTEEIKLGKHGVLVRKGGRSGVFLPQVATETGWSKEEFLNNLCAHKAGLSPDAWKDKTTEIYIFSAEVFSEKKISE